VLTAVDWMGALGMFVLVLVAVSRERRWFEELLPEIQAGVISADEYQVASVYRARLARGWQVLSRYGPFTWLRWSRYVQMIVDLAYKKHQQKAAGEGIQTDRLIASLRQRIGEARGRLPEMEGKR